MEVANIYILFRALFSTQGCYSSLTLIELRSFEQDAQKVKVQSTENHTV